MSRRASRPAGPVTPETDQLVGTWTRVDDASSAAPPVRPAADGGETADQPGGPVRRRRRVTTQPVAGYDPTPPPEPARHRDGENDDQLRRDVPPHW
ncbi:hypothetical protein DEJ03_16255 [Curtobacterium sp. MCLR17_043]|jgi:hypothetical protein|nr:hypothetical protein DEJ03_16255 [Curtobacterium sp. MCLR17_043]RXF85163.1 hypothetical protein CffCFBP3418_08875 [Curtobacterium flaccumfaciens pv. flaccumfaciens]